MTSSRPPRRRDEDREPYSARRAIALWVGVSLAIWIIIAILAARLAGPALDTEADRLSKIAPAAGKPAPPANPAPPR